MAARPIQPVASLTAAARGRSQERQRRASRRARAPTHVRGSRSRRRPVACSCRGSTREATRWRAPVITSSRSDPRPGGDLPSRTVRSVAAQRKQDSEQRESRAARARRDRTAPRRRATRSAGSAREADPARSSWCPRARSGYSQRRETPRSCPRRSASRARSSGARSRRSSSSRASGLRPEEFGWHARA